jgi:hypothetical protein
MLDRHLKGETQADNRVLEKSFWPKKEVIGHWRKLHNEKLRDLNWSPNIIGMIIREDEMGEKRVNVLIGRPGRRWGIILKCIFKKYIRAWTGVNWFRRIRKKWWAAVKTVMNIRSPSNAVNFRICREIVSF